MAIEYSNANTPGCNYIIEDSLFTISYFPVEFDQTVIDEIRADLASCLATKQIDLGVTGTISNPQMVDSYIWYYAADIDLDGIVDAADLDQNPGSGDTDNDGIIDAADIDLTAGTDLNLDGVDDDYLNDPINNAFILFGTGTLVENFNDGIYKVSIETVYGCIIEESFDVSSSAYEVETTIVDQTCGVQGSITIDSIEPIGNYVIYWHEMTDSDLNGIPDRYEQLTDSDGDGIPDAIDVSQNPTLTDSDGDQTIDVADVDSNGDGISDPGKTDSLVSGIDDEYLLVNILRVTSFNNLFTIDDLGPGVYRLEIQESGSNQCGYRDDFTILSDEYSVSVTSTTKATICSDDPVSYVEMGSVTFEVDGTYMIDSYLLYKALDSDNDGLADLIDVDQAGGTDTDNDGIIDTADVNQTGGSDTNNDGIDDSYDVQLKAAAMSDPSPMSIPLNLDNDGDGIADNVDVDQTGGTDSDGDGIDDIADADQTGGTDVNGDGIDDSIIANPNPISTPFTDTIDLMPGSYAMELVYNSPLSTGCNYALEDTLFTILSEMPLLSLSNISTTNATICSNIDPVTLLNMGSVTFDVDGTYMIDSYLLYKALDSDNDGLADVIDIDQNTASTDSDKDGIIDAADVNDTGGTDANGDGIDDSYNSILENAALADPSPITMPVVDTTPVSATSTPFTDTIDLIPGSYAIELLYNSPLSTECTYPVENLLFTIFNDGLIIENELSKLVCYGTEDASISLSISKLEPSTFYTVKWTEIDPITNVPGDFEKTQVFSTTSNHDSTFEPKTFSATNLISGRYKVEVWKNEDPDCRYEFEGIDIEVIQPVQIIPRPFTLEEISGEKVEIVDDNGTKHVYTPDNQNGGFVINPSCDTFVDDGEIKVQILGNDSLNKEIKWYLYQLGDDCLTYTVQAKDFDNDGVPDYADSDLDGDGIPNSCDVDQTGGADADGDGIDDIADFNQTGGADTDNDGIDDSFDTLDADKDGILNDADLDPNDSNITSISLNNSLGIATYQNCDSDYINIGLTHQNTQSSGLTVCAKPGELVLDAQASEFFIFSGGTQSCSLSTWVELPDFEGINYLKNLAEGKYKVVVTEIDPKNPERTCSYDKEIVLIRDAVNYDNVRIDQNICIGETGVITVDLIRFVGLPLFNYNGEDLIATEIPSNNNISADVSTYEFTIDPVEGGLLYVSNEEGCSTVIDPALVYTEFPDPDFDYSSESYDLYSIIPKNENIRFELTSNTSNYSLIEWDFGDITALEYGNKVEHSYIADGIYEVKLTVYNEAGCSKEITKQITIGDGYLLLIPNVFTPNNDGVNDVFEPKFSGFRTISMSIFNAYGNLLYESPESGGVDALGTSIKPIIIPWDGASADLSSKMYIYHIVGTIVNGEVIVKTGTLQILK
jgi:hypothetical protein